VRFITTRIHGVLDYVMGLLLIASPWLFGFEHERYVAHLPIILGAGALAYSAVTRYELGVIRVIPMGVHLALDIAAGALLMLSPWLFGFSDRVYAPHLIFGILEFGAAIATQTVTAPERRAGVVDQQRAAVQ
jgi:hypothetical protein